MPEIRPIPALSYARAAAGADISRLIAPPYDVLDEGPKRQLLAGDPTNIVAIDLPFTPPKVVGPNEVYQQAGQTFRTWLAQGILQCRAQPAMYVYQQVYTHAGREYRRGGLIANVRVQEFGPSSSGRGGVWPHEQTFSSGKEDRLKLMRACQAQLSPIFGIYRDTQRHVGQLLEKVISAGPPTFFGTTAGDNVRHNVWEVSDPAAVQQLAAAAAPADIYIADGHHRYHTALNYRNELAARSRGLPAEHPANFCMFVLAAMEDPGMIVLPTHRVLGGMTNFSFPAFVQAAQGKLQFSPFAGNDLVALEKALPAAGSHAVGLYVPAEKTAPLGIATTRELDPLAVTHSQRAAAWRQLDVAIVQHLIVEQICQPHFCPPGQPVTWRFPHELEQVRAITASAGFQIGIIVQPTPLSAVAAVSQAGELMPQKSTFFYPKLATGLVFNPLTEKF